MRLKMSPWAYRAIGVLVFVSSWVLAYLDETLVATAIVWAIVLMVVRSASSRMFD